MSGEGAQRSRMVCGCRGDGEQGSSPSADAELVCAHCGLTRLDSALEQAIVALLAERPGRTICPSEAARRVDPENWRELMAPCREAARRLAWAGRIHILKGGETVDPDVMRGPVRLASA